MTSITNKALLDQLMTVLEFYAEPTNYFGYWKGGLMHQAPVIEDGGRFAKNYLDSTSFELLIDRIGDTDE